MPTNVIEYEQLRAKGFCTISDHFPRYSALTYDWYATLIRLTFVLIGDVAPVSDGLRGGHKRSCSSICRRALSHNSGRAYSSWWVYRTRATLKLNHDSIFISRIFLEKFNFPARWFFRLKTSRLDILYTKIYQFCFSFKFKSSSVIAKREDFVESV